jgi:hypothetical protein
MINVFTLLLEGENEGMEISMWQRTSNFVSSQNVNKPTVLNFVSSHGEDEVASQSVSVSREILQNTRHSMQTKVK